MLPEVLHPIIGVARSNSGKLEDIGAKLADKESFIHLQIGHVSDAKERKQIEKDLEFAEVQLASKLSGSSCDNSREAQKLKGKKDGKNSHNSELKCWTSSFVVIVALLAIAFIVLYNCNASLCK